MCKPYRNSSQTTLGHFVVVVVYSHTICDQTCDVGSKTVVSFNEIAPTTMLRILLYLS